MEGSFGKVSVEGGLQPLQGPKLEPIQKQIESNPNLKELHRATSPIARHVQKMTLGQQELFANRIVSKLSSEDLEYSDRGAEVDAQIEEVTNRFVTTQSESDALQLVRLLQG